MQEANFSSACYTSLHDADRERLWRILGHYACATSGTLDDGRCVRCDGDRRLTRSTLAHGWEEQESAGQSNEILSVVRQLCDTPEVQSSSKHRVLAILAIRSFVMHTKNPEHLDLNTSFFAQWCLKCMHSSLRELRIAAGRTLSAFLRTDLPKELRDNNRRLALDFLRALSAREMTSHDETLILAWGQIAVVCGDRELNLALLRLIDYLGHPNTLVCSLAFSELEAVSECLSLSPEALIRPFHRSIAVAVVQDLSTKPQKIQCLTEFLGTSVGHFLVLTQRETIPFLVLTKRKDILQRIASARKPGTSIQDLCLSPPRNLAAVLGFFLTQPSTDVEHSVISHLTEVAPGLHDSDLASLVKIDPVLIACEMLEIAADTDEANLPKVCTVDSSILGLG